MYDTAYEVMQYQQKRKMYSLVTTRKIKNKNKPTSGAVPPNNHRATSMSETYIF